MTIKNTTIAVMLSTLSVMIAAPAKAVDLHQYWDQRCAECHGHSGTFSRENLKVENDTLVGRHHKDDLLLFLRQHKNEGANADGLYAMLKAQVSGKPVFQQKCLSCHGTAAEFARTTLRTEGNRLTGKDRGAISERFLARHGKLTDEEAKTVLSAMLRVVREVGK